MKEPTIYRETGAEAISLLAVGTAVLRRRRLIVALSFLGAAAGLASALLSSRIYAANATFIPEEPDNKVTSSLALAAGQFGIKLPSSGGGWGPAVYAELLNSRALLQPIAGDTFQVPELGRRVALMDLLRVKAAAPSLRLERAVRALSKKVTVQEDKKLGAVRLSVATKWPSVSYAVATRLVQGVNQFNLESRKTQAGAERRFVEAQALEAERALRDAEERLQLFRKSNRGGVTGSPDLALEKDRLERDVTMRQQNYTSLSQSREEAKISEVRNTPVITVLEQPQLPVLPESRRSISKTLLGGIAGGILGVIIAFLAQGVSGARAGPTQEAREFFELVDEATPRFLRRG
jgi:tyrosine-protein kinase Etk/Wzc